MNSAPDNLDPLLKLLSDKRKSTPPPVYFDQLSDQVMARIHKEQQAPPRPWYERYAEDLDAKFIWTIGISIASCCFLIAGIWFAHQYFKKSSQEPTQKIPFNAQPGIQPSLITSSSPTTNIVSSLKPVVNAESKLNDFKELKNQTGLSNIVIGPAENN